jgi:hypothetical protein
MKGFSGFGNDKKSPAKVSSQSLVDAQAKLDKTELDFRQPGWAIAAKKVHEDAKSMIGSIMGGKGKGKGKGGATANGVASNQPKITEDNVEQVRKLYKGDLPSSGGEVGDTIDFDAGTGGMHA